jgi:hypothetical protein
MKLENSKEKEKPKVWKANLNEDPGLESDLKKLMLETGSKTHGELLSRLSFAHRNTKTIDKIWKLMLKPDSESSKSEMIAKRFFLKVYNLSGVSTRELSELVLMEIDKVQEEFYNGPEVKDKRNNKSVKTKSLYRKHINYNDIGGN